MSALRSLTYWMPRLGAVIVALACQREAENTPPPSVQPAEAALTEKAPDWVGLEQRRDVEALLKALEGFSPAAEGRVAAVRALARIGGPRTRAALRQALFDDDLEVVRWAAFGLGEECEPVAGRVKDLVARAASLHALAPSNAERSATLRQLATALGRCGSDAAEEVLRGWLTQGGELSDHGAWGLGQLASRHGYLAEKTQVALLDQVAQGQSAAALFPFTRLARMPDAVRVRLLEVTGPVLTDEPSLLRSLAVRALGQAGRAASEPLARVLAHGMFSVEERATAAQALGRLGDPGQKALASALAELPLPEFAALEGFDARAGGAPSPGTPEATALEGVVVWSAALDALERPGRAKARLGELAQLAVPEAAATLARRRAIALRCRAADLLAGMHPGDPVLRACDPDESLAGAQALLRVLDRGLLEGPRLATWRGLVKDVRPVVRQGALRLLGGHAEVPDSAVVLRQALESDQLGTAVTALQILAAYPARASSRSKGESAEVDRAVALAVEAILRREEWKHSVEALAGALDALGALGILSTKSLVESFCKSPHRLLREHAARSLGLLGDPKRRCDEVVPWPHTTVASASAVRLDIDSDVGPLRLHLDAEAAPAALRRVTELARAGYYDGLAVHRVVEGFVVQFGDAPGDGFGDPKISPLPCERGPSALEALDVGMAIAGPDTAAAQWFVVLGRYPQLDGAYTRIGRAEGPWHLLMEGDVFRTVRVAEGKPGP